MEHAGQTGTKRVGGLADRAVAVTGATGFVGARVVAALRRRGWRVRALARDAGKAYERLPGAGDGVEVVVGDVFNADARRRLVQGAHAVVHLIGIRRERSGGVTFEKMHVDATRAMVAAALEVRATRFLHMSALGTRPEAASRYHRTKFEAERIVRESGLAWTIFRPSLILGAEGEFMAMARGWVRGEAAPKRFLPYFTPDLPPDVDPQRAPIPPHSGRAQPIDVEDVAEAFARALEREETAGEVYPLGGADALDWPDLLVAIRDADPLANPRLRPRGVPANFARRVARAAKWLGLAGRLPFTEDDMIMACEDNTCAIDKALAHGVCEPRGLGAILERAIAAGA